MAGMPLVCLLLLASASLPAAEGTLMLVGGGMSQELWDRFIAEAGGPDAPIVVIPTAGGGDDYPADWIGMEQFRKAGMRNVVHIHTYDRSEADTETFAEPIRNARAVWFTGGRQWRLADSYLDTEVHKEIRKLLQRGGIVGGSSAGATIQGEYLARGDTSTSEIMMGDHERGLALLPGTAVDQHLLRRNRQFDLLEILRARPELLGIGLDEYTAILVKDGLFEVIGRSYVAIYDPNRKTPALGFYFLAAGDRFELETRTPLRQTEGDFTPLELH